MAKREENFEINLLPVISLLAVCISFLLVTAVWVHIGSMEVSQAVGQSDESTTQKTPAVEALFSSNDILLVRIKNIQNWKGSSEYRFEAQKNGIFDWDRIENLFKSIKLNSEVKTLLIFPSTQSVYENLIKLMDSGKKLGLTDIGISPI